MKVINVTRNSEVLASNLRIADNFFSRMKGLLGKRYLAEGEGLLIKPCKGIHTFGMKFPIDALFLDAENRVVATSKNIPPNRVTRLFFGASSVIELSAGTIVKTTTTPGDQLHFA